MLGRIVNGVGATKGVEIMASYLNILVGKGCGTGWDKGEKPTAANVLLSRKISEPVVIDCGGNRGDWTSEVRHRLGSDRGRWIIIEPASECVEMCKAISERGSRRSRRRRIICHPEALHQ